MQLINTLALVAATIDLAFAAPLDNVRANALERRHGGRRPEWATANDGDTTQATTAVTDQYTAAGGAAPCTITMPATGNYASDDADTDDSSVNAPQVTTNPPANSSQTGAVGDKGVVNNPSTLNDAGFVEAAAVTQPSAVGAYTQAVGDTVLAPSSTSTSTTSTLPYVADTTNLVEAAAVTQPPADNAYTGDAANSLVVPSTTPSTTAPVQSTYGSTPTGVTQPGSYGGDGEGTVYDQFATEGACGAINTDDAMIAAVSLTDYADKSLCGKKVQVTNTGPLPLPGDQGVTGEGNVIEVTIVDLCEGCARTDIDLSRGAWSELTDGFGDSRTGVNWVPIS